MDWPQILVGILVVFLLALLAAGITLVVLLVQVSRQIKSVSESAKQTAEHIEEAMFGFGRLSSPLIASRLLMKFFKKRGRKESKNV